MFHPNNYYSSTYLFRSSSFLPSSSPCFHPSLSLLYPSLIACSQLPFCFLPPSLPPSHPPSRSLTKLSSPEDRSSSLPRVGATGSAGMGMRGRSWSNLSLSHAPSMTSVMEEPRRSTSTTSEYMFHNVNFYNVFSSFREH